VKWTQAIDRDDKLIPGCIVCEEGYRIARFVVDGERKFRASFKGEFICHPEPSLREVKAICERHHQINKKPGA